MKKITIKSCEECPYCNHLYKYKVDHCDVSDRQIHDKMGIPRWCTLEAGQEAGKYGVSTIVDVGNDAYKAGYEQRGKDPLDKEDRCEMCYRQGIKEVVDWINSEMVNQKPSVWYSRWQAKLKEWGL